MRYYFIVPYRDRPLEKEAMRRYFNSLVLPLYPTAVLLFINQSDTRPFNRGALKNIGALYVRRINPYEDCTLVFHDVDIHPTSMNPNDLTVEPGTVKQLFGIGKALGGIYSIRLSDFIKTKGYPNYWGWVWEDNLMFRRFAVTGGKIARLVQKKGRKPKIHSVSSRKAISINCVLNYLVGRSDDMFSVRNVKYSIEDDTLNIYDFNTASRPGIIKVIDIRECFVNNRFSFDILLRYFGSTRLGSVRLGKMGFRIHR